MTVVNTNSLKLWSGILLQNNRLKWSEVVLKWSRSGLEVVLKWSRSGLEVVLKWSEVVLKWLEVVRSGLKWFEVA